MFVGSRWSKDVFRSQTSDNVDIRKAEMGRGKKRRGEERRSEKRKSPKKEDPDARKGRKVAKHCVFPMICGSGGSTSRLPDGFRALLDVEMRKKCTPMWRGAHVEVKMYKAHHARTTFGSWDVQKVHAVVVRSTFWSQKCKKIRDRKHFWTFRFCFAWQAQGFGHLVKSEQNVRVMCGFVACPKTMAGAGHLKRISKDAFSVAGAVQETCSSELLGGPGADFLRGVAFWSIRPSGLLKWFCVTDAALRMTWHHFFRGRRNTLDRWSGKITKRIGTRPSALHSTFHSWRKSRRIVSFLMLPSSKIEEVSQTCFVFDVVKFKIEELSQNCCLFNLAGRQTEAARQTNR